ncbi:MAG: Mur ligase domain-containing protein [Arhodomonas sp.]|nr:Mur ligase domain-containing protein [Arhodomonas sp.]
MTGAWDLPALLRPWVEDAPAGTITELALDSREVRPGGAFLAVRGSRSHGIQHLEDALARGAGAVLWEPAEGADAAAVGDACAAAGVAVVAVPGLATLAGPIAARFFGEPAAHLRLVGSAGTDGKTSCSHFIARALDGRDEPWAVIGTLGWGATGPAPGGHPYHPRCGAPAAPVGDPGRGGGAGRGHGGLLPRPGPAAHRRDRPSPWRY